MGDDISITQKKAQINLDFIVSIVLLSVMVISVVAFLLRMVPDVKDEADLFYVQSRALDINRLLIDDPGAPANWSNWSAEYPTSEEFFRVGFALFDNYSNEVVYGQLDIDKVKYTNASLDYSYVKNNLGVENETDFRVIITNATTLLLDLYNNSTSTPSTRNVVVLRRFMVMNHSYVNVTLMVW